jgi:hypothetical protein
MVGAHVYECVCVCVCVCVRERERERERFHMARQKTREAAEIANLIF